MRIRDVVDLQKLRKDAHQNSQNFRSILKTEKSRILVVQAFFKEVYIILQKHHRIVSNRVPQELLDLMWDETISNTYFKMSDEDRAVVMDLLEGESYGEFYKTSIRGEKRPTVKATNFVNYLSEVLKKLIK